MLRVMDAGLQELRAALRELPIRPLREAIGADDTWVVGGFVRDLLAGGDAPTDLDIAVDGDVEEIVGRLGSAAPVAIDAQHSRFGTATVRIDGLSLDLARTRSESYAHPGALPDVSPAGIDADLARRDFSVNAMAIRLDGEGELLDPFGGRADLREGVLRVLHGSSIADDPTRAVRAARYASRLGLEPEPGTLAQLRAADLATVTEARRRAELTRLAAEASAATGFRLLSRWGVLDLDDRRLDLLAAVDRLAAEPRWRDGRDGDHLRTPAIILVAAGGRSLEQALKLAAARPERPSEAVRLARGHAAEELLVAAAAGGDWVSDYVDRWREQRLLIDGDDLIAAGIPRGPAVGAGLQGALERKLDGALTGGREAELELAVELARRSI
ncbi:MAG: hypothetical protein U0R24_11890 [Solirubrobacterales bacterium]